MSTIEMLKWLHYVAPPLTGAFIGYLTNKVAIRMLFRPFKKWFFFGFKVPMTPGVIPAKRKEFARDMGKMVGDHLLTSEAISKALKDVSFQDHLHLVIEEQLTSLLNRNRGSIQDAIPSGLHQSYNETIGYIVDALSDLLYLFLQTEPFEKKIKKLTPRGIILFRERVEGGNTYEEIKSWDLGLTQKAVKEMLLNPLVESWFEKTIRSNVYKTLQTQKSLNDLLPEPLLAFFSEKLDQLIPYFTQNLAEIFKEDEIRALMAKHGIQLVEKFIQSKGPIGQVLNTVISNRSIEELIDSYLLENKDVLDEFLQSESLQSRLAKLFLEKKISLFATPLVQMVSANDVEKVDHFCDSCGQQLCRIVQSQDVIDQLLDSIRQSYKNKSGQEGLHLEKVMLDWVSEIDPADLEQWSVKQWKSFINSKGGREFVESGVKLLVTAILEMPIGRLSDVFQKDAIENISTHLRDVATRLLKMETAGLVESLNIKEIVTERINSFDLLQIENLLLSIMAEQFKYINMFGAIIGFLIGCLNVLFI